MSAHDCKQEENIGRFKEFIDSYKGMKTTLFTIALAILLQVGTFLYLWGTLTNTVSTHEKNIEKIWTRLDSIHIVGYVYAEEGKIQQK